MVENNSSNTMFKRWSEDGNSFYVSSWMQDDEEEVLDEINVSYEVYEITN